MYKPGGVEKTIHTRLKELSKIYKVFLITLENGNKPFYYGELENIIHIDLNLNFKRKENDGFKLNIFNILKSLYAILILQYTLFRIKPLFTINVVGKHSFYFLPFMFFTGEKVLEHHASFYENFPNKINRIIMNKFDRHIFLTKEEYLCANFINKKKYIIPNPIQKNNIIIKPYSLKAKRIVAAGRIVSGKGFDRLLEAWKIIENSFPDWKLEIYGEPDINILNKLENYIKENNLRDRVEIKPSTLNILNIMNDSKIFAMTSHFESFSLVLIEAMSLGMAVVTFDCPTGPRNIIKKDTGYLVENNNIKNFANCLKEIIINDSQTEIVANKAYEESKVYSLDNIIRKWIIFFSN